MRDLCTPPLCLVHGDVRIDNVFFGDDHVALVDWQGVCLSAPEHDVAYFITQSVPIDRRDQQTLLDGYHDALDDALARRGLDFDRAASRARYETAALYLLCYAVVIAGTLDMGNERGVRLARSILHGSLSALDELDAFRLLQ
jgi:aminoglycoside phosphotransferase (APT) family kinase protein